LDCPFGWHFSRGRPYETVGKPIKEDALPMMMSLYVAGDWSEGGMSPTRPALSSPSFLVSLQYAVSESLYGIDGDNAPYDDSLHVILPRIQPDPSVSTSIPPSLV
jgi:hypothetical protein